MSTEIAVRLPHDMVRVLGAEVAAGRARSSASLVERALAREIRRLETERDIAILQGDPAHDDLARLAAWCARQPVGLH